MRGIRAGIAAALTAAVLTIPSPAAAQARSSSALPALPAVGCFLVQAEVSSYRAGTFVDSEGERQDFFGSLDSLLATLRIAYSPAPRLALGVEIPYRSTRLPVEGAATSTANGFPGAGVFLAWSPVESGKLGSAIRLTYFRSRGYQDRPLTVSDGADRYSIEAAAMARPGLLGESWRAGARWSIRYASAAAGRASFIESEVDLRAGPRLARLGDGDIRALALAGYALSTEAQQEGLVLHDLKARRAIAGVILEDEWPSAGPDPPGAVRLAAEHDFVARNSLSGWRLTLSLQFGL